MNVDQHMTFSPDLDRRLFCEHYQPHYGIVQNECEKTGWNWFCQSLDWIALGKAGAEKKQKLLVTGYLFKESS